MTGHMNTRGARLLMASLLISAFVHMFGCGTSDTSGDGTRENLTGSWELATTIRSNTCGAPNDETETETIYLRDSSDVVSVTTFSGPWGEGEPDGNKLDFEGSAITDDLGCQATLATEGTGTVSATTITGRLRRR